ncbi:MOSC domain-containing protein [Anthocerotibacter panamensis]|uniref:MOSC domain-containing protein n=1 Tax=Anthocerotibacter panamensis TaxID=2857077 RepID=UPI001C4053AA|nr:MOSC N-terminal beta barrel domain-containing protein [Anthocerotibacter panamensis]
MPTVTQILVYPIKSLDPVRVAQSEILSGGTLAHDREYAIRDEQGRLINGKCDARVHQLRAQFELAQELVHLEGAGHRETFHLTQEREALEAWLSSYFGRSVHLEQDRVTGFPDDLNAWGPTIISTATLEATAHWFPGLTAHDLRLRLRANIEVGDVPGFWEDSLFGETDYALPFLVGAVHFEGVNPCSRCIVPTRDPLTGEPYPDFQRHFVAQRKANLPSWTPPERFNHFYKLSTNTRIPRTEAGKTIHVGDLIRML